MTTPTQKQSETLTPCWYVKDFADGWIKFYDVDMAIAEAKASGAIMCYSENGAYPDRAQPSETPVAEKVKGVQMPEGWINPIQHTLVEINNRCNDSKALQLGDKVLFRMMAQEALALLDQQGAYDSWKPINSAPKDGTKIIVYADDRAYVKGDVSRASKVVTTAVWDEEKKYWSGWPMTTHYTVYFWKPIELPTEIEKMMGAK